MLSFLRDKVAEAVDYVNKDLMNIFDISKDYGLILNPSKTKVLFVPKNIRNNLVRSIKLNLKMERLEIVQEVKNLNLYMDYTLRFETQENENISKAICGLRAIYQHRSYLSKSMKIRLCEVLVLSHFNYRLPVYGSNVNNCDMYRMQKVQNSCLRFIYGIRNYDRISHK